jgi:hypothetical protein
MNPTSSHRPPLQADITSKECLPAGVQESTVVFWDAHSVRFMYIFKISIIPIGSSGYHTQCDLSNIELIYKDY